MVAGIVLLTTTSFGQVLKVEPEKPKWGDMLKITYDPSAPGATFTDDQRLQIQIRQSTPEAFKVRNVALKKDGKVLSCEVRVQNNVRYLFLILRQGKTRDRQSRQTLMVYGPNGQPVRGAYLSQVIGKKADQEWIDKELALYPDNYLAYIYKWQTAKAVDLSNLKNIIEADINRLTPLIKDEPPDGLYSLATGYLYLDQEEKSRTVLRKMVAKYPNAQQTGWALSFYHYEGRSQRFTGTVPEEVKQMVLGYMQRNPTTESAREFAQDAAWENTLPIENVEMVLRQWIKDEPQNPTPYLSLVHALNEQGLRPEQSLLLSDKALELLLDSKAREFEFDSSYTEVTLELVINFQVAKRTKRLVNKMPNAA